MAQERSRHKLLEFLDYMGDKGLMAEPTIRARKAAASRVLGILSEDEASDVTRLDLDSVMSRFINLEGKGFTTASLNTYLSRLKSAVNDFESYVTNPLAFRPSAQTRERRKSESKKDSREAPVVESTPADRQTFKAPLSSTILPIPIRPDVTVFVQGLPYDLTEAEAGKIANVVRAMAALS